MASVQLLVAAGIAYLNVIMPDWYKKINLETLHIASAEDCIVGQLYAHLGGYGGRAFWAMYGTDKGVYNINTNLGFSTGNPSDEITKEWKKQIKLLRRRDRDRAKRPAKTMADLGAAVYV